MGSLTIFSHSLLLRCRVCVCAVLVVALVTAFVVDDLFAYGEDERATPVVGSFGVGGGLSGGIDERTGKFATQIPLKELPGIAGSGGGFSLEVSYSQDVAPVNKGSSDPVTENDRFGLGSAWTWGITSVDTNGAVRVFPASGGVFEADSSVASGLAGYVGGDLVFRQHSGVLPPRDGGAGEILFAYFLEYAGGIKDYFNAEGDLVARVDLFDDRVDLLWEAQHRLRGVVDAAGSHLNVVWTETGVEIVSPERSDGVVSTTTLDITGDRLVSVTNPLHERVALEYADTGFLHKIVSDTGAVTEVEYQILPDMSTAVDRVQVRDSSNGAVLSHREWKILGEHTPAGYPTYLNQNMLWNSGDGEYRYHTVLSDGSTDVVSEYNSLGLLISRDLSVSTSTGDRVLQQQNFIFEGTETGGVPPSQALPKQYFKPTQTQVIFHDDHGRTRRVSETMEYNKIGQITRYVGADGAVTETVYDTQIPEGKELPIGLVVEHTTTGYDGQISKTVNTLSPDRKSVQATETFVGGAGALASTSRTEVNVDSDGFVSERRVIATAPLPEDKEITRFSRVVDKSKKTVTLAQSDAAGSNAESTSSVVVDISSGLTLLTQDPTGRVASTRYDVGGRASEYTSYTGLRTTTEYGKNVTRVTDPRGITRSEYTDVLGQIVRITDNITTIHTPDQVADGGSDVFGPLPGVERVVETRRYEQNSSHVTTTDARGLETVTVSDIFGRLERITAPNGVTQIFSHDDVANTTTTSLLSSPDSPLHDALYRSMTQKNDTNRDASVTVSRKDGVLVPEKTTHYDGLGRVTGQTSADISTTMMLNPDGTAKTTTLTPTNLENFPGEAQSANRNHNLRGVTKKTLTQSGQSREGISRLFDAAGRTVLHTDQAGNTTTFEYTTDGLVSLARNKGTGVVTRNTYDTRTRALVMTETIASDGTVSHKGFDYDSVTGNVVAVFDPFDRDNTEIRYIYDVFGNMTSTIYPDGKMIRSTFDEHGRKTSTTDMVGNTTRFDYTRYGLLASVEQTSPHGEVLARADYQYDEYDRVEKLSQSNGVTTAYTFTSANQIATEKTAHKGHLIHDGSYRYDGHGNLVQRIDKRAGLSSEHAQAGGESTGGESEPLTVETIAYMYNAYDQLIESRVYRDENTFGEPITRTAYKIDVSGNVTQEITTRNNAGSSAGLSDTVRTCEYNVLGQCVAVTTDGVRAEQNYDSAGNLTHSANGTAYTYNVYNQLVTEIYPDGTHVENTYWASGQRRLISTTASGAGEVLDNVELYWDGTGVINDTYTDGSENSATRSYLLGSARHARTFSDNADRTEFYVTDRHGNVIATTDTSGVMHRTYEYTDYGQTTTHTASGVHDTGEQRNPFQYSGEYTTSHNTQLLGNRVYTPTTMAFTTKDTADVFNVYAYGNANPITTVDPSGRTSAGDSLFSGVLNGVMMGVTVFAAAIAIGTCLTAPVAGAWLGVAVVATAADLTSAAISGAQLINNYHPTAHGFINPERNNILTWAGVILGFGAALSMPAAAAAIEDSFSVGMRRFMELPPTASDAQSVASRHSGSSISLHSMASSSFSSPSSESLPPSLPPLSLVEGFSFPVAGNSRSLSSVSSSSSSSYWDYIFSNSSLESGGNFTSVTGSSSRSRTFSGSSYSGSSYSLSSFSLSSHSGSSYSGSSYSRSSHSSSSVSSSTDTVDEVVDEFMRMLINMSKPKLVDFRNDAIFKAAMIDRYLSVNELSRKEIREYCERLLLWHEAIARSDFVLETLHGSF